MGIEEVILYVCPLQPDLTHHHIPVCQRHTRPAGKCQGLLRRLATLLSQQASLMASNEAFKKQAEGASNAAKKYMEDNEELQEKLRNAGVEVPEAGKKGAGPQEENKNLKEEVKTLKEERDATKKALQKSDSDVQAMKKQAENLTVEYDRLLEEHSKLLATSDKKSD
ncbi:unnamed protein product [Pleuronectes platessa]|uniref:Endoplasmic reticulum transmembrane protein n=1 Tax=Pleuronectes platessa TaxID=8262 RepID=A0A9N7UF25_PLEPL|nr:unnamed protein product [Pleuronectes platessa]